MFYDLVDKAKVGKERHFIFQNILLAKLIVANILYLIYLFDLLPNFDIT